MEFKEALAQYFEEQSWFRQQKAEEYPEDSRNARAARGLLDLANYVRELPADDPRIVTIAAWNKPFDPDVINIAPSAATGGPEPSRFRFDSVDESVDEFLTSFARGCATSYAESTGQNYPLVEIVELLEENEEAFPRGALALLAVVRRELDQLERRTVARLRDDEELSWEEIGELLGKSKQAAWEKHRRVS